MQHSAIIGLFPPSRSKTLRDWTDEIADAVVALDDATSALGDLIDAAPSDPAVVDHVRRLRWALSHTKAQVADMERIAVEANEIADRDG